MIGEPPLCILYVAAWVQLLVPSCSAGLFTRHNAGPFVLGDSIQFFSLFFNMYDLKQTILKIKLTFIVAVVLFVRGVWWQW